MLPVFCYWNGEDAAYEQAFAQNWASAFPDFRIYGQQDVAQTLRSIAPECVELLTDLRIASAQSDICRYAMLYAHGGLYTDCHFGFDDAEAVRAFVQQAHEHEVVAVENGLYRDVRSADHRLLISGFLFARPGHPLILAALRQLCANLAAYRAQEQAHGWQAYDIWRLCGPWVLNVAAFANVKQDAPDPRWAPWTDRPMPIVRPAYEQGLRIVAEETLPVERNRHKSYVATSPHWSHRQTRECLFHSSPQPLPAD
ncbi:MAG TPA: glycosyltransferase [Novosphingobium sp.]|nr:glycosyltransferase [Novosphingobium sp.]